MFQRNSKDNKWDTPYLVIMTTDKKGNMIEKVIPEKAFRYLNKDQKTGVDRRVPANTVLYTYVKSGPSALLNKLARRDAPVLGAFFGAAGFPDDTLIGLKYKDGIACVLTVKAILGIVDQVAAVDAIMTEAEKRSLKLGGDTKQPIAYRSEGMDEKTVRKGKEAADDDDPAFDWLEVLK